MGHVLRILVILIGIGLILVVIRQALARRRGPETPEDAEQMISCRHCEMHIPKSKAVFDGNKPYCSPDHRKADQGR